MHNTYNRDKFISINKNNIRAKAMHNFRKRARHEVSNFNYIYDYESVMHYRGKAFSKNGMPTINVFVSPDKLHKI